MNQNSKQIIEVIGIIAVIASVLLLTYELNQANQIARTDARFEISNSYASMNESVYSNPQLAELLSKLRSADYDPSPMEHELIWAFVYRNANTWIAAEFAYNNGQYPEAIFGSTLDHVRKTIGNYPGTHSFWSEIFEKTSLADNYQVYAIAKEVIENASD